jgi:hypothetical protein
MSPKNPPEKSGEDETTTVRVRRKTLHLMQIIAAWKNLTLTDYLDHLMREQGTKDLDSMKKNIHTL